MIPAPFLYHRATSLEDAFDALGGPDAKALAGGMSLLPLLKLRVGRPGVVVDIGRLELDGLERVNGTYEIGTLTTWQALAGDEDLRRVGLDAIVECASAIGDLQVRNRGTIGGGLAHADPAADMPAVALALGMELVARSRGGERRVDAEDFFAGPFTTALAPEELLTAVRIAVPPEGSGSAYVKVEHPASGFALAGAACLALPDGTSRIGVTGIGSTPVLLAEESAIDEVEVYGDRFAGEEYRRHLLRVVVRRAVELARSRAGEGGP